MEKRRRRWRHEDGEREGGRSVRCAEEEGRIYDEGERDDWREKGGSEEVGPGLWMGEVRRREVRVGGAGGAGGRRSAGGNAGGGGGSSGSRSRSRKQEAEAGGRRGRRRCG
eukprot:668363-Hanusia_phi.AAC.2